ncbi:S1C family serine protease [Mycolicibacterium arenosum]|uniref:Trypsin-like peptidase domain-containing protein n=1 Tax=Mycolicibacterium arenosum TaxID=2952157 RepID=A0ABT1M9V4_9MYCO|nr:trypsin-like peptidase domain-containing protein [Mycolicibacterium sp. CAU 1645]MCP9275944.1 trypsin-like peptidase domain-containing protein [Mycolicibacterium sp. CAU 1645]
MTAEAQTRRAGIPVVAVAVTLVLSACANPPDQASDPSSRSPTVTTTAVAEESSAAPGYVEVVERVSPSVVTVLTDGGQGSGVVLRPDVVVTNAHVVGQQRKVSIVLADGTRSPGEVVGTDEVTDVAVVRTERGDLPVAEFREDLPRPGERVLAIGSPLGFQNSVSAGIISGLHRDVPGSAVQTYSLVDLIQTDASISPGNSGGALLDTQGRVVGINEAYIPPAAGAVSIGFAIPTATVLDVAEQLLADGTATHPYLGVSAGRLTDPIQQRLDVQVDRGAVALLVDDDAPAARAGVKSGDVIVELAGQSVGSVEDLLSALRQTRPGQQVALVFVRGDQRQQVEVTIGSRST